MTTKTLQAAQSDENGPPVSSKNPLRVALESITGPWTWDNLFGWVKMAAIVLAVLWLFVQPFRIPSDSMFPTLDGGNFFLGDRVAVNKLIYGPRVPFTNTRIFSLYKPKRWDIVVFYTPHEDATHKILIKRVVGLPGEQVHIQDGKIHVNGEPVPPPAHLQDRLDYTTQLEPSDKEALHWVLAVAAAGRVPKILNPNHDGAQKCLHDLVRINERLDGRSPHELPEEELDEIAGSLDKATWWIARELVRGQINFECPLQYGIRTEDEYAQVPPGSYFLLGDNSAHSVDGRFFGWVPEDNLLGRAFCVWWPFWHFADFTGFSKTWWGMLLIIAIPLFFVLFGFVFPALFITIKTDGGHGLGKARHVLVARTQLHVAFPGAGHWCIWRKRLEPGDVVAFVDQHTPPGEPVFGRLVPSPATAETAEPAKGHVIVRTPMADGEARETSIRRGDIIGKVLLVWWPLHRPGYSKT